MQERSPQDEDEPVKRRKLMRALRWMLACVALLVAYAVVPVRPEPDLTALVLRWCATVALLAAVAIVIRLQVLRQLREAEAPFGALVLGILAGLLLFALIDYSVATYRPGQFEGLDTRVDALYYALTTLLTVGFGDIYAHGQLARVLLCVQMVFNVTAIAGSASLVSGKIREQRLDLAERRRRGR